VNNDMNVWVSCNVGRPLSNCTTGSFSRRAKLQGDSFIDTVNKEAASTASGSTNGSSSLLPITIHSGTPSLPNRPVS
jgi:hypothetical protein